jgi:hypothetical protein
MPIFAIKGETRHECLVAGHTLDNRIMVFTEYHRARGSQMRVFVGDKPGDTYTHLEDDSGNVISIEELKAMRKH